MPRLETLPEQQIGAIDPASIESKIAYSDFGAVWATYAGILVKKFS